jgi:hypothetical protein
MITSFASVLRARLRAAAVQEPSTVESLHDRQAEVGSPVEGESGLSAAVPRSLRGSDEEIPRLGEETWVDAKVSGV